MDKTNKLPENEGKMRFKFILVMITALFINNLNAQLAIFPFEDHSGFKCKWDLKTDIPYFFRSYLSEKYDIPIASPNLITGFFKGKGIEVTDYNSLDIWKEIYKEFKIRYIMIGTIKDFKLSKFNAGFPLLGGYESYSASQVINYRLYDVKLEKMIITDDVINSVSDKGLGITLAGKPTDRNKEYNSIDDIPFGGEDFTKTLIGESMIKLSVDLASQIQPYVHLFRPDQSIDYSKLKNDSLQLKKGYIYGTIIMLQDEDIFIDLGSSDGLLLGEKLMVYFPDFEKMKDKIDGMDVTDKIAGIIEVKEIRSNHFSLCKIHMGKEKLKTKFIVQKPIIK
jgi:hypothetical protein